MRMGRKRKRGFTFTEVMVTLAISSLLIPAALYTNIYLLSNTERGSNLAEAAAEARYLKQFLVQKINSSGKNIRISDDGNSIILERYNETTGQWEDDVLAYNSDRRAVLFYHLDASGNPGPETVVAEPVYKTPDNHPVFSPSGNDGTVQCVLYTGKQHPDRHVKTGGYFIHPGVYINIKAAPINIGDYNVFK